MLIKIIKDGNETEWLNLTAELRDTIINENPDWIVVHIQDLYPGSPDSGETIKLEKTVFCVVSKDFIREQERQAKQKKRHLDKREFDSIRITEYISSPVTPESRLIDQEIHKRLELAKSKLTPSQLRRLHLHFDEGLSLRKIAAIEGVHNTSVEESIQAALKKIKKYF